MRATLLVALFVIGAACAASVPARCSTEGMDPQPALTCDLALEAVRRRLATVAGVEEFEIRYGGFCPPGAQCPDLSDLTSARVYLDMGQGIEQTMVVTLLAGGTVVVGDPVPVGGPTPLPGD